MAVTTKQIAEMAGVSRGTVDRALHDRGRVKQEVAERIKNIAAELGYYPNLAAKELSLSKRQYKFGVYVQFMGTPTMDIILGGVQKAVSELEPLGVKTSIISTAGCDKTAEMEALDTLLNDGCQALALVPTTDSDIVGRINDIIHQGVPVVTFNCDIEKSNRLSYVGMDNLKGGCVAGTLMGCMLPEGGKVLPITAYPTNSAHYLRIKGFSGVIETDFPDITLLPFQSSFDSDIYSYQLTKYCLDENPDLKGIYVASNGAHGAVQAVCETGRVGKIRIISFDLNPTSAQDLLQGYSTIILDQHPEQQGYNALHILYDTVVRGLAHTGRNDFIELSVVTKYNLPS